MLCGISIRLHSLDLPAASISFYSIDVNLYRISDVGRVSDWHKAKSGPASTVIVPATEDPGITLTTDLKDYFVTHGLTTEVMGASFRSVEQVTALAGCDHLTIGQSGAGQNGRSSSENVLHEMQDFPMSVFQQPPVRGTYADICRHRDRAIAALYPRFGRASALARRYPIFTECMPAYYPPSFIGTDALFRPLLRSAVI